MGKCLAWEVLSTPPTPVSSISGDTVIFATWSVGFMCSNLRQELGTVRGGDESGKGVFKELTKLLLLGPHPLKIAFAPVYRP